MRLARSPAQLAAQLPVLLPVLLTTLLTVAACGGEPAAKPAPTPTSLAQLKPAELDLVRVSFCDLVPARAVEKAVGGTASTPAQWSNGERPPVAGADPTHELGCAWALGSRAARAWVFARPVTAAFAAQVVAEARKRKGCTATPSAAFGKPGMTQTCRGAGGVTRVRHAGLFGDTWLTCEVAGPERVALVSGRADAWCTRVATTLSKSG